MTAHFALGFALLAQASPAQAPGASQAVRVWLPDTTLAMGEPARVYVALRDTSQLVVLHVDPAGRIRVLFPLEPAAPSLVPGGETFAVAGIEDSLTFRVAAPGIGTILAVRASPRTPFRLDPLSDGSRWDYENALLLQPTAGNPFAALLDIADRIADGQGYSYDLAQYRTPGAVATRPRSPQPDSVCFSCLAARHSGGGGTPQTYGEVTNSAIAIDHSYAAAPGGTVVDCSEATLMDSFCGVDESTTYPSTTYVTPVEETVFFPFRRFHRFRRQPPPPPLPKPAIALNLRRVPGPVAPPRRAGRRASRCGSPGRRVIPSSIRRRRP